MITVRNAEYEYIVICFFGNAILKGGHAYCVDWSEVRHEIKSAMKHESFEVDTIHIVKTKEEVKDLLRIATTDNEEEYINIILSEL